VPDEILDRILSRLDTLEARIGHNGGPPLDDDAAPLSLLLDSQVLTFAEWCRLNRFSQRTGRRVISAPGGPPVVRLSPRRIGITVGANRLWQQSRERA
jgi:hypothetical protein